MKKTYVLDTNVLIQSPYALQSFEDNKVVLPVAIRFLEHLRQTGNLYEGVRLDTGGIIKIEPNFAYVEMPYGFKSESNDNRILKVCKGLTNQGEHERQPFVLSAYDAACRMSALGISI